jgi:hypothetical protein
MQQGHLMKIETRDVFIAYDGRQFATAAQCRAHERETCGSALVGLTEARIEAIRNGADLELGQMIEMFARTIRKARQDQRRPNGPEPTVDKSVKEAVA